MPLYLYKCPKCAHKQDVSHSMTDTPTFICPECSTTMIKIPGLGAVRFSGNGWGHQG